MSRANQTKIVKPSASRKQRAVRKPAQSKLRSIRLAPWDLPEINRSKRVAALQEVILLGLEGICEDPMLLTSALTGATVALIAKAHPGRPTKEDREKIRTNDELATNVLIKERAMSQAGIELALAHGLKLGQIALDYSPLSFCHDLVFDDSMRPEVIIELNKRIAGSMTAATHVGLSPFGATMAAIIVAVSQAIHQKTPFALIAYSLVRGMDALLSTLESDPQGKSEDALELMGKEFGMSAKEMREGLETNDAGGNAASG